MSNPSALPEALLSRLVAELSNAQTVAVALGGSHARGDATAWSDVDVLHIVAEPPARPDRAYHYQDGRLISIATRTLGWYRNALQAPERAIFIVPAIRESHPLHDPLGSFRAFQAELQSFHWEPLRPAAQRFVSQNLVNSAEAAHKLLSAEVRTDVPTLFGTAVGLFFDLTLAVVVGCGRLIDGQRSYFAHAQAAAGRETHWTHLHQQFATLDTTSPLVEPLPNRATLALQLYVATVRLLRGSMLAEQAAVVDETVRLIEQTGRW